MTINANPSSQGDSEDDAAELIRRGALKAREAEQQAQKEKDKRKSKKKSSGNLPHVDAEPASDERTSTAEPAKDEKRQSKSESVSAENKSKSKSVSGKGKSKSVSGKGKSKGESKVALPAAPVKAVADKMEMDPSLAILNDGLSAFVLNQRPQTGKMLLSPKARQVLEAEKDYNRRGRASSPEPKAPAADDVSPLESPELGFSTSPEAAARRTSQEKETGADLGAAIAAEGAEHPPIATESDPAKPASSEEAIATATAAATITDTDTDTGTAAVEGDGVKDKSPDDILDTKHGTKAAAGTADAVNSFLSQIADEAPKYSDDDSFEASSDIAKKLDADEGTKMSGSKSIASVVEEEKYVPFTMPYDDLKSCPYVPALAKFIGYADDFEHTMVSVHKGTLYIRIGDGTEDASEEVLLAKFPFSCPEVDQVTVEDDRKEIDQFIFKHKLHGIVCIRVALEHKFLLFETLPEDLFQTVEDQLNQINNPGASKVFDITIPASEEENVSPTADVKKPKATKDFLSMNKAAISKKNASDAIQAQKEARQAGKPGWNIAAPKKSILGAKDHEHYLNQKSTGESANPSEGNLPVNGDNLVTNGRVGTGNNGPANSMSRAENGNVTIRRRSVEYLLQGVGVTELEMLSTSQLGGTAVASKKKSSEGGAAGSSSSSGSDACNNTRGIASGVMEKYTSRGKDYRTTKVSHRRGVLLTRWLNSLQLQPATIEISTLHENLCSGLLLADLVRMLIPSASYKFSQLHIPALSKATALSNVEQCLGIILRSKAFVFSERIPKPIEVIEACGSGDVGHRPKDALVLQNRATSRLLSLLDELFRAFVMKDFISFSVDVPTMVTNKMETASSAKQRRRQSYLELTRSKNSAEGNMGFEGDRYSSGGIFGNGHEETDSSKRARAAHKSGLADLNKFSGGSSPKKVKAPVGTFGASAKRPSYIQDFATKEADKKVDLEEALMAGAPLESSSRDYEVAVPPSSRAPKQQADEVMKHGNVPIPTERLIEMLEWYQSVLHFYQRGFSLNVQAYIENCRRFINNKEMLKSVNMGSALAECLEGVWASMQSGVALFCIIMHFYGHGTVLDYDGLDSTGNKSESSKLSSPDTKGSTLRAASVVLKSSSNALRIDPIFVYAIPRSAGEHRSNITYLFRLMHAIGITEVTNVNDWLYNPDPDFLILQLYDIFVSVGQAGGAECVLPSRMEHVSKHCNTAPEASAFNKAPFSEDQSSGSDSSTDEDEDEAAGHHAVHLVQITKGSMEGAYIQGLFFADDLGFGENGDNDIDLALMDGFGGSFDMAKKSAQRAKDELAEAPIISSLVLSAKEQKKLAIPAKHDIQKAIDARFASALARNQVALGGITAITRHGLGLGGMIRADSTGAGGAVSMLLSGAHQGEPKSYSYSRIRKERSVLVKMQKSTVTSKRHRSEDNYLHVLFGNIREAEKHRDIKTEAHRHHPHHKNEARSTSNQKPHHHHRHYTTGELLLRALVVGDEHESDVDSDEESESSGDMSSVEYSVDSDGEILITEYGELKVHVDKERQEAKSQLKAKSAAAKEVERLSKLRKDHVFDFSDLIYKNLGIDSVTHEVKSFRIRNVGMEMDKLSPQEFLETEAKFKRVPVLLKAVTAIAELYSERTGQIAAINKEEDEIEAEYHALEDAAQRKAVGREEFEDKLAEILSREKDHGDVAKSSRSRFLTVLDSLALQYAEAVRECMEEEAQLLKDEEAPPPPSLGEPDFPNELRNIIKVPSSPEVRGTKSSNMTQNHAILLGKNDKHRALTPSQKRKNAEKERERNYIGAHTSAGEKNCLSESGYFSVTSPLASREPHDYTPKKTEDFNSANNESKEPRKIVTLFSDLADAEEVAVGVKIKARSLKPKSKVVHVSEITGKKKVISKDTTISEVFSKDIPAASSKLKSVSDTTKQMLQGGWNRSHSHHDDTKSHNKVLSKKSLASSSKRLAVTTPTKLRHRLITTGGIYSHGKWSNGVKPNITERLGMAEVAPAKFIYAEFHGADAVERAKDAVNAAYDEGPMNDYFAFMNLLHCKRDNWREAHGMPALSQVNVNDSIKSAAASPPVFDAPASPVVADIKVLESSIATPFEKLENHMLSVSEDIASIDVLDDHSVGTSNSLGLSDVARTAATSSAKVLSKSDTNIIELNTMLARPGDDQEQVDTPITTPPPKITGGSFENDNSKGREREITTRSGATYTITDSGAADLAAPSPRDKLKSSQVDDDDVDEDSDYVPSVDEDLDYDSDSDSLMVEEIPSLSDAAVEDALRWLSVPRPARQLNSAGAPISCTIVLANDVTGYRIVGPGSKAAEFRKLQLSDLEDSDEGASYIYDSRAKESGAIRPVMQVRDGEGLVPMHQQANRKIYVNDIISVSYASMTDERTQESSAEEKEAKSGHISTDTSLDAEKGTGMNSPLSSPYSKMNKARVTSANQSISSMPHPVQAADNTNIVKLQLKTNHRRSVLAGRGRATVFIAFDDNSESDARHFVTHILTLIHTKPSALHEQEASQQYAKEVRLQYAADKVRAKAEARQKVADDKAKRVKEHRRIRAAKLAQIENKKRTAAALKATKIAKNKAMRAERGAAKRGTSKKMSNHNKSVLAVHEDEFVEKVLKVGDVKRFDPPREFKCIFKAGAFIRCAPIDRSFIKSTKDNIGLLDFDDIVLVKSIHSNVKESTFFDHDGVIGGSYFELAMPEGGISGWVPVSNGAHILLEEVDAPPAPEPPLSSPSHDDEIVDQDPADADNNTDGGSNYSDAELKEIRAAICTLVVLYDSKNEPKLTQLLSDWRDKEVALLHVLHEHYALKMNASDDQYEGDGSTKSSKSVHSVKSARNVNSTHVDEKVESRVRGTPRTNQGGHVTTATRASVSNRKASVRSSSPRIKDFKI